MRFQAAARWFFAVDSSLSSFESLNPSGGGAPFIHNLRIYRMDLNFRGTKLLRFREPVAHPAKLVPLENDVHFQNRRRY